MELESSSSLRAYCLNADDESRQEFLRDLRATLDKAESFITIATDMLYKILWSVALEDWNHASSLQAIHAVHDVKPDQDWSDLVSDVLWIVYAQLEGVGLTDKQKQQWMLFCRQLVRQLRLNPGMLMERLEPEHLEELSLVTSAVNFNKKLIRINTGLLYKQQKYNLVWEENEGYSRLVVDMMSTTGSALGSTSDALSRIHAIIGYFDLDPNRVLDVILDCFEQALDHSTFFVDLLRLMDFKRSSLCDILGFKFSTYYRDAAVLHPTPKSLCTLAAVLIRADLVQFVDLYPHLRPFDEDVAIAHKKTLEDAHVLSNKSIILNSTAADAKDHQVTSSEKPETFELFSFKSTDATHVDNQKFGLIEALFEVGASDEALLMVCQFPRQCAASSTGVALALCHYVESLIQPYYREIRRASLNSSMVVNNKRGWADEVIKCLDDRVWRVLRLLGPGLSQSPQAFSKLCRLGRVLMHCRPECQRDWVQVVADILLPAMSLIPANPGVSNELWTLIKVFPYDLRYSLYAEWSHLTYDRHAQLVHVRSHTVQEAKKIMRRLSKDNTRQFGRKLGKLSHANPTIVLHTIIDQLQSYDNMVQPVVEALKYVTTLSFDVLACKFFGERDEGRSARIQSRHCIDDVVNLLDVLIEALSNPTKPRLKEDGTNLSSWLQNLAVLCGTLYRKYSIDLNGLLHYVVNQLRHGNSLDLIVVKELIQKMASIESFEELSESQVLAFAGGEMLRTEASQVVSGSALKSTKRSSQRLLKALMDAELAFPLAVLISRQRNACTYEMDLNHLKLIGGLVDQCQETLFQYITFLRESLDQKSYDALFPSIRELVVEYQLEPDVAFFMIRQKLQHLINRQRVSSSIATQEVSIDDPWQPGLKDVIESVSSLFPNQLRHGIGPAFYTTFWQLSLADIYVPQNHYKMIIDRNRALLAALDESRDMSSAAVAKRKRESDQIQLTLGKHELEVASLHAHHEAIKARLLVEKERWFIEAKARTDINDQLIQFCVFPRCCFSAPDAVYCAKWIRLMHDLGTVKFSSLSFYDRIVNDLRCTIYSRTQNEASHYGRFLAELLSTISRWHGDAELYLKEAKGDGLPGFQKKWTASVSHRKLSDGELLSYEDFRRVVFKWHVNLLKAFSACLESKEYMQIRNALIMLTKIIEYFPIVGKLAISMEEVVVKLKEDDREDLKILATRYHAMLLNRKSVWIAEESFHSVKAGSRPPSSSLPPSAAVFPANYTKPVPAAAQVSSSTLRSSEDVRIIRSSESSAAIETKPGISETMTTATATATTATTTTSTQIPPIAETKKRPVQAPAAYAANKRTRADLPYSADTRETSSPPPMTDSGVRITQDGPPPVTAPLRNPTFARPSMVRSFSSEFPKRPDFRPSQVSSPSGASLPPFATRFESERDRPHRHFRDYPQQPPQSQQRQQHPHLQQQQPHQQYSQQQQPQQQYSQQQQQQLQQQQQQQQQHHDREGSSANAATESPPPSYPPPHPSHYHHHHHHHHRGQDPRREYAFREFGSRMFSDRDPRYDTRFPRKQ